MDMKISKVLSANDTGENGSHQAGILIPKRREILGFFPLLSTRCKNPRVKMFFLDNAGHKWRFQFIYYNNRFFGGTRNEYRLTGLTRFFRENNLMSGDTVVFSRMAESYYINHIRKVKQDAGVLELGTSWKTISF